MERADCAIVVNTCPKYFYLLETHFALLRRYAPNLKWPVYLATEKPEEFQIQRLKHTYNLNIIPLQDKDADFFESRVAAMKALPQEVKYVLPIQEDFLLERPGPDGEALQNALEILDCDRDVLSLRLMPCPGSSAKEGYWGKWKKLVAGDMTFSYQATIWRREVYREYMERLIQQRVQMHPDLEKSKYNYYAVTVNPAETFPGLQLLSLMYPGGVHLCWPRVGAWANAVYNSPWPYRPTAVVKGRLEDWAQELAQREGFYMSEGPSSR
jgi:hypothetical protein